MNNEKKGKENKEKAIKVEKAKNGNSKNKDKEYVMKKNIGVKIGRFILWEILLFIFIKGVISSFQPDRTAEVKEMIGSFKEEFYTEKDNTEEILGFAQNFAKEYLTYDVNGKVEFVDRITPYVSKEFDTQDIYGFKENAKATYVKAYKKQDYSSNQTDVYVLAEVRYVIPVLQEDGKTYKDVVKVAETTLKVPVYVSKNGYCIEDIPLIVKDRMVDKNIEKKEFLLLEVKIPGLEESLVNFLTAYYSQDQGIIDYYLVPNADKDKFIGINNRYKFEKIEELKCYKEEGKEDIVSILSIKIKDTINDAVVTQNFNLVAIKEGDRFYIKDINTKLDNLVFKN